jgi:hypothetical protein
MVSPSTFAKALLVDDMVSADVMAISISMAIATIKVINAVNLLRESFIRNLLYY